MSGNRIYDAANQPPQPKCKMCGATSVFVIFNPRTEDYDYTCTPCMKSENRNLKIDDLLSEKCLEKELP